MNYALILAGGVGVRVGAGIPKQFIEVLGKPILVYTLEIFQKDENIDEIVLVCVASHIELAKKYCKDYNITKAKLVVEGGKDFIDSCLNGMDAIKGVCKSDDVILVTSADRPFISPEEIEDSIRVCKMHGSGIPARKCPLCMFEVGEDRTHSSKYRRESLMLTSTPWSFSYGKLSASLEKYRNGELKECESYPIAIFAADGNEVFFSKALPGNIKITEKTDIALMECILKQKEDEGSYE